MSSTYSATTCSVHPYCALAALFSIINPKLDVDGRTQEVVLGLLTEL